MGRVPQRTITVWRHARPTFWAVGVASVSLALMWSSSWGVHHRFDLLDLAVYRDGSQDVLGSGDLYQDTFGSPALPFTYPPAAAIVMIPLRLLGLGQAGLLWTSASLASLLLMVHLARGSVGGRRASSAGVWKGAVVLFAAALWLEPVQSTLSLGQVNLMLDGLVMLDLCAAVAWVPRGTLVGVAAAIKLVPLFFVAYLVVVRRTREAATAATAFLVVTLIGWLLAPDSSRQFWTRLVFDTDRVGSPQYVANQSLHGVVVRLLGVEHSATGTALWVCAAAVTAAWGLSLAARVHTLVGPLQALLVAACTSLLVAPVSWSHYYVWMAPVGALLVTARGAIPAVYRVAGLACVSVFVAAPIWWVPHGHDVELHYSPLQQLAASSYVIATLGLLAVTETWTHRAPAAGASFGKRSANAAHAGAAPGIV